MSPARRFKAVLWDFGGVVTSSPFEAFARYEARAALPEGFIRRLNSTNPDDNAWAKLERNDLGTDEFCTLFEAEAAAAGHLLDAREVLGCLEGTLRPEMVRALEQLRGRFKIACLTNNSAVGKGPGMARAPERAEAIAEVMKLFDLVLESSKAGVRKPEPRFYEIACERLDIAPADAVFLDDLGINLKPARTMGMHTIKVTGAEAALAELGTLLDMPLG